MYDKTPWGMINARKEAAGYKNNLTEMEIKINKAIVLLKSKNPDIKQVINILEEALKKS